MKIFQGDKAVVLDTEEVDDASQLLRDVAIKEQQAVKEAKINLQQSRSVPTNLAFSTNQLNK